MNNNFWDLVFELVPDHGVANTVQGELVRAVLRLTAECCRNGCGNWDGYFEALVQFTQEKFTDGTLDSDIAENAQAVLTALCLYARDGEARTEQAYRNLCDEIDEPLEKAASQWCHRHSVPIPFEPDTDYGASG